MRVRAKSYETAIVDEVQLAKDAQKLLQEYQQQGKPLLNAKTITAISDQYSPDFAARVFYEAVLQSEHGDFIKQLQQYSDKHIEELSNPAQIKIIIVPGMFYKEHSETGADGKLAMDIAKRFGFETARIELKSGGSITDNSAIIEQTLRQEKHANIWLLSISKGSSDVRHFLQHSAFFKDKDNQRRIRGWVNVAGIPKGLPYADYRLATPTKRLVLRLLAMVFPVDYQALLEMKTDHPYWQKQSRKKSWQKEEWAENIDMIHLVPVPHSAHIQGFLSKKYHITLKTGPNDGLVPLTDNLELPGHIYPIWGYDHFMRTPNMSAYLYQLFNYIVSKNKIEQAPIQTTEQAE